MSIKDLVSNIKHNGLMTSMAQLEKLYRIAIENEEKLADMAVQLANAESKCRELAAENAGLKANGREVLKEAAYVYSHYNRMVDHLDGESVDGQTLHEFQEVIENGIPTTDADMSERGE